VIDSETLALLQDIVRRESRSVLTYVGEAFPWTSSRDSAAWSKLQQLLAEEGAAVASLGRFLARRRSPVSFLGSYPSSFTTLNFVALEHLVPRLVAYQRRAIADLARDLARISDPEAQAQVAMLLEIKGRDLPLLEGLNAPHSEPATAI
jgi:hypothetical protein